MRPKLCSGTKSYSRSTTFLSTARELLNSFRAYSSSYMCLLTSHSQFTSHHEINSAQVLGRHWLFEGAGGQQVHVPRFAEGLIGQKPKLEPGQWFAYGSGCSLPGGAPGFMRGALLVEAPAVSSSSPSSGAEATATAAEVKEGQSMPSSMPATWEVEVASLPLKTE